MIPMIMMMTMMCNLYKFGISLCILCRLQSTFLGLSCTYPSAFTGLVPPHTPNFLFLRSTSELKVNFENFRESLVQRRLLNPLRKKIYCRHWKQFPVLLNSHQHLHLSQRRGREKKEVGTETGGEKRGIRGKNGVNLGVTTECPDEVIVPG
jgi:hypothetical protein